MQLAASLNLCFCERKRSGTVRKTSLTIVSGLILMLVSRAEAAKAAEVVFRTVHRQQLARFLRGLRKLGLADLPHAVACAQYHYLSNQVGGVKVECVFESHRKPGYGIRRPAGYGRALRSAESRRKYQERCCAAGMPITVSC
jgi:hypothetical protein